jgi:aryl-alcohol dehydrogenase-like predicted oxidoreductase
MRYLQFEHSDIEMSAVIAGGWQAGGEDWPSFDKRLAERIFRRWHDAGVTTFDTAEEYGRNGHGESVLAEAFGDRIRDVVIITKVSWQHLAPERVNTACENSLRRLRRDWIDGYLVHWPAGSFKSKRVPIAETMDALQRLKQQGKIRAIGVSNFSRAQLEETLQCGPIDAVQDAYSLLWRRPTEENGPWLLAKEKSLRCLAYSPLAQGLLTGKFQAEHGLVRGDNRIKNLLFKGDTYRQCLDVVSQLHPYAERYGISLAQLAIGWVIGQADTAAVIGATSEEQVIDNAHAAEVSLSAEDTEAIGQIASGIPESLRQHRLMWEW